MGVKETYEFFKEFNLLHPDIMTSLFVCRSEIGAEDFLQKSYIEYKKVYINKNKELYKLINPSSTRLLNCFGLCYKNASKRVEYLAGKFLSKLERPKEVTFREYDRSFDLGGSLVINNLGKIMFKHQMKFISDHANPEKIIKIIKETYGDSLREKMISEFIENIKNYDSKPQRNNSKTIELKDENILTEIEEENNSINISKSINKVHRRSDKDILINNFKQVNQKSDYEDENIILNENSSILESNSNVSGKNP